jgi:hypothetical protein
MKAKFFFFMMCWCAQLEKIALPEIIKKGNFFQDDGLKSREKYSHEATLFDGARIKCLKKAEQLNDFVESDTYKNYEKELRNRYENG